MSDFAIAYLAQGKIRLKAGAAAPRNIESVYGQSIREKAVRTQQKNSWKGQGNDGSPFSAAVWGKGGANAGDVPVAITSLCAGKDGGKVVYSLESGNLCALLEVDPANAEERRLWNDNRTCLRHVTTSARTGDMACSVLHENGTANIAIRLEGESGVREVTEGDSFDTAPHWQPGEGRRLVFQSAGIGRDRNGHFRSFGPFCLQRLDAEAGEMETLLENENYDYLAPQFLPDDSLLYIRRPYSAQASVSFLQVLKDVVLFPVRLGVAIFSYLNFFSAIYSGKKLTSAGGAKAREMDMKQMMIWGNLVQSRQAAQPEEEGADLVPKSWQLQRRRPGGEATTLAQGVLAYDVHPDGTIVYTNGNAIFLVHPDGRQERMLTERMIEQVHFVKA